MCEGQMEYLDKPYICNDGFMRFNTKDKYKFIFINMVLSDIFPLLPGEGSSKILVLKYVNKERKVEHVSDYIHLDISDILKIKVQDVEKSIYNTNEYIRNFSSYKDDEFTEIANELYSYIYDIFKLNTDKEISG